MTLSSASSNMSDEILLGFEFWGCIAHGNITFQLTDGLIMMILNCKHICSEDYDILCMHWSVKQLSL